MGSRAAVLTLTLLVLTAGCVGQPALPSSIPTGDGQDPVRSLHSSNRDVSSTVTAPGEESAKDGDDPEPPSPAVSLSSNPWHKPTVVVGIDAGDTDPAVASSLVERTIAYWEANDQYGTYSADFVLVPNASSPDVLVRFDETVACNGITGWLGCAPVLNATSDVSETEVVRIQTGYSEDSTLHTLKHEFGHLVGLHHGDDPMPLMKPNYRATLPERPDATERVLPWEKSTLYVYIDYHSISGDDREVVERQVEHALEYYENRTADQSPRVKFIVVGDRSMADVVVDFDGEPWCGIRAGSCGKTWGRDVDGDGKVEYYTRSTIVVTGVRADAVGWHVGYWMGTALGASGSDELPPPFRNGTGRTGEWWV